MPYVYWSAVVIVVMPLFVVTTTTSTTCAVVTGGAVTVIFVSLTALNLTAAAPKRTVVAPVKPCPLIVTVVPPATGPADGDSDVIAACVAPMYVHFCGPTTSSTPSQDSRVPENKYLPDGGGDGGLSVTWQSTF